MPAARPALFSFAVLLGAAVLGCRPDRAPVEELYVVRTLGLSYLQRNQLTEAEAEFRKLTRLAPDDPAGYADLGLTFLQAGRLEDAERELRRARDLDPAHAEAGLALARLYSISGRAPQARAVLEELRRDSVETPRVLHALAALDADSTGAAARRRAEQRLREVLVQLPANLAVRMQLTKLLIELRAADSAVRQLEEIRRIPPALPMAAQRVTDSIIQQLRSDDVSAASASFARLMSLVEITVPYQSSLDEVRWSDGPIPGRLVLNTSPSDFASVYGVRDEAAVDVARYADVSMEAGFTSQPASRQQEADGSSGALAAGDVDGDGTDDLFVGSSASARLYRVRGAFLRDVTDRSGIALPAGATVAEFADVDNDGWLDLLVIGSDRRAVLFRNNGDGTFENVTPRTGIGELPGARQALFADLDHDGDLDLLVVGDGPRQFYRNNLDGSFTETTAAMGLGGGDGARRALFADFDVDGRMDVLTTLGDRGSALLHNEGVQRFRDIAPSAGLGAATGGAADAGDYDNDGFVDLLIAAHADSGGVTLWRNRGDGTFARDSRSPAALRALRTMTVLAARFVDHDNDGALDIVAGGLAAGRGGTMGLALLRNDRGGRFTDRSNVLPETIRRGGASAIVPIDADDDGDVDLAMLDAAGAPRLLRNDMGNANLGMKVELKGLRTGSGKNNAFGIGSRVELRAGTIYQMRTVTDRVTHFGLGPHLKGDVLRVEWPNGVPQTVYLPGTDQDVVEGEMLKGSCAFVYTWDGTRFRFVTDAMWRSALGMPLGLMGSTTAFAPAGASQEYVRIPGDALRPRDGRYVLQVTEELWETAYADQLRLLTVDHPDSVDVFVDERFVPPGPLTLKVYQVSRRFHPRSAVDERGRDVLPALLATDDVYVSNMTPMKYQGVVAPHDLVLDLDQIAGEPSTYLFLRGWIYPTDASINVALSQQSEIRLQSPSLEVRDANGRWRTAIENIGFPSGKDKTVIVDLAGQFTGSDRQVRIRTNLQIYWDEAFVAHARTDSAVRITTLAPVSAHLHERGFSRMYRKGGRYGPYWYDYDSVTRESPWRPIEGAFTRFGDVLPLLERADDMYVIMAPGDELTVSFDARSAPALPDGWRRDFLFYSDGWIKDSDLNTAFGTTVEPLPFRGARSYPYSSGEAYPASAAHERYRQEYNTRVLHRVKDGRKP